MAKTTRAMAVGLVTVAVILAADRVDAARGQALPEAGMPIDPERARVRSDDPVLSRLIQRASDRSATFRRLVERIQATDGVVYIERGRCGPPLRACLALWIAVAGPNRILRVVLDDTKQEDEAMASIGHELRHALEVLDEPTVKTVGEMYFFFRRDRGLRGTAFETDAAVEAGFAVSKELKRRP